VKKVVLWIGIGAGLFVVVVILTLLVLRNLNPGDAGADDQTSLITHLDSSALDSMVVAGFQQRLDSLQTINDSLTQQLTDATQRIDSLQTELQNLEQKLTAAQNQMAEMQQQLSEAQQLQVSLREVAKTYEAMKVNEMGPILQKLDDRTVIMIYRNINARKRKNLLLALPGERAAQITQKMIGRNPS